MDATTALKLGLGLTAILFLMAARAEAQTIRFLGSSQLPPNLKVQVLASPDDTTPADVRRDGTDWLYNAPANPSRWRVEPIFVITIPARNDPEGITAREMQTILAFSIPATELTEPIEVPLVVYQSFSGAFLAEVDGLADFEIFQRIQYSQQLALHFKAKLGPRDDKTRRMMQLWFDSLHRAIVVGRHPLRVHPDVMALVDDVFAGEQSRHDYIVDMYRDLRSTFWRYEGSLATVQAWPQPDEQCFLSRALLADAANRHLDNPADASLQFHVVDPNAAAQLSLAMLRAASETICG